MICKYKYEIGFEHINVYNYIKYFYEHKYYSNHYCDDVTIILSSILYKKIKFLSEWTKMYLIHFIFKIIDNNLRSYQGIVEETIVPIQELSHD